MANIHIQTHTRSGKNLLAVQTSNYHGDDSSSGQIGVFIDMKNDVTTL